MTMAAPRAPTLRACVSEIMRSASHRSMVSPDASVSCTRPRAADRLRRRRGQRSTQTSRASDSQPEMRDVAEQRVDRGLRVRRTVVARPVEHFDVPSRKR